jgi:hypothetical protein
MIAVCRRITVAMVSCALLAGCAETYRATGPRPEGHRGNVSRGNGRGAEKEKSNNGRKRGHDGQRGRGNGRGNHE